jgi:hypothetical protein
MILEGDGLRTCDFSVFKAFKLAERSQLEFRAEFFNLPNTPSFAVPNTLIDAASGGLVTATSTDNREIEFALKLYF